MSAADEFPLPPGDPGALRAAGSALQDVSTDLSALGTRIGREQAGMAAAWQGDAAAAAGTETSHAWPRSPPTRAAGSATA